jgi:hypothetical protein
MSEFIKYPHLERFGHADVDGIDIGECWVFPKLDGTNASVWLEGNEFCAGSRTRKLSKEQDNAGFFNWFISNAARALQLRRFLMSFPVGTRIYGEWLVPHTLRTYREDVWRRFWIFDVFHPEKGFLTWEDYVNDHTHYDGVDIVQPIAKVNNPNADDLLKLAQTNTYLIKDGEGIGEGVVLKRYGYVNRFGRTTWAKLVMNEFKEQNKLAFGVPEKDGTYQVEYDIAQHVVTKTLVDKERAKIELELLQNTAVPLLYDGEDGPYAKAREEAEAKYQKARKQLIPRLLETVYHCVVTEELWAELKRVKVRVIDFDRLRKFVIAETKKHMGDIL